MMAQRGRVHPEADAERETEAPAQKQRRMNQGSWNCNTKSRGRDGPGLLQTESPFADPRIRQAGRRAVAQRGGPVRATKPKPKTQRLSADLQRRGEGGRGGPWGSPPPPCQNALWVAGTDLALGGGAEEGGGGGAQTLHSA